MKEKFYPDMRDVAEKLNIPVVKPETAEWLFDFVCEQNPSTILEIGTAMGYSALIMAQASGWKARVDTVEISVPSAARARTYFEKYDRVACISLHCMAGLDFMKKAVPVYDLIFADARKDEYADYFYWGKKLLIPGGLMIFDNLNWQGKVTDGKDHPEDRRVTVLREFRKVFLEDADGSARILDFGDGVGIYRLKT